MVVKGVLLSVDYAGNTCMVRIPIFESAAGGMPAVAEAIISNTPGCYNGYKPEDVVLVAFEVGHIENPVVIGKLYLGAIKENQDPRGMINCNSFIAQQDSSLPLAAKLDYTVPDGMVVAEGATSSFKSFIDVINGLQDLAIKVNTLETRVAELEKQLNAE